MSGLGVALRSVVWEWSGSGGSGTAPLLGVLVLDGDEF